MGKRIVFSANMRGRRLGALLVALLCGAVFGAVNEGLLVRTRTDLRSWQTVMTRTQQVCWAWAEGADSARVSASNRVSHAVRFVDVIREDGVRDGACPVEVADTGSEGEAVVDVRLEQSSAGRAVSESTATLAYVGGVNGESIVVRSRANRDWRRRVVSRVGLADAEGGGYAVYDGTVRGFVVMFK